MATEFVPSGVIEKASLHDMIYAACPRCFTSMNGQLTPNAGMEELRVQCASCSTFSQLDQVQFKYRLELQLLYGSTVADAMLFDEAAESLLGVPASEMKSELLPKYPSLPQVLEELLVGLHVSFSFQRPAPKRNAKHVQFMRDLKVAKMEPLIPQLLPEPAAKLAVNLLRQCPSGGKHLDV
ncbi:hypothetical protein PI124_g11079 [Phytophthora idaei]|nr:hypothetical protein PI125_g10464 [Phytophthora idaei]KAG3153801.1 hypothetical protein PI126_g9901 [Phytophthora idaei]KAG3244119.1 hypothetical protein PI124_g11079 [Phytophthora idaei]